MYVMHIESGQNANGLVQKLREIGDALHFNEIALVYDKVHKTILLSYNKAN
jgi:hypothetical protein